MTNLLALNRQSYRDHCLIVIGPGTLAEEVLAKRRLNAGGRLLHVLTDQNDQNSEERVVVKAFQDLEGCFFWQPPRGNPLHLPSVCAVPSAPTGRAPARIPSN